ncbi:Putative tricarboxylic transport membrane protein [Hyphomicrobiales bacterium]|nr:putative tricarboxylic transport membrane protein [Hyphomicrobiales bacterium]CAH1674837.1 Putative tricarboxylic transport membrane protein [Hyphomicrobiales bacterium]
MTELFRKRDVWSGAAMAATGLGFLMMSFDYPMGTGRNIGAGAFPAIVAGLLVLVGVAVAIRGALEHGQQLNWVSLKPFALIIAAIVAFAALLPSAGFIMATGVLVVICAMAHPQFRPLNAFILAAAVIAFGAAVFIYGLGLPIKLIGPALSF